jgi:hypothetical protein
MQKREGFNKFIAVIVLLIVLTLVKKWFNFSSALVWLGVLVGYYLPFFDHLFYAYIVRPDLEISRNIRSLVSIKKIKKLITYVNETKDQRDKLIIHTAYFQMIFSLLTFFILSSSMSLFGRGLVYGFCLKLLTEELYEYFDKKDLSRWFAEMNIKPDTHATRVYLYANGLVLLIFSLML